jgi:hypothetical protein
MRGHMIVRHRGVQVSIAIDRARNAGGHGCIVESERKRRHQHDAGADTAQANPQAFTGSPD